MNSFIRSDLALETAVKDENTRIISRSFCGFDAVETDVLNESGALNTGRKLGKYYTICTSSPWMYEKKVKFELSQAISQILNEILPKCNKYLAVGLGNHTLTADSLGPCTVDKLTATRHLKNVRDVFESLGGYELSAIKTGVEGQTGIRSFDIVKNALLTTGAECVIAIDSLCARSLERLSSTVQITNAGISPGSGVGRCKAELSESTLGIPVISIGIPTVVSSSTLVYSALTDAGIEKIPVKLNMMLNSGKSFFVSSEICDTVVLCMSEIIARGIEISLKSRHKNPQEQISY